MDTKNQEQIAWTLGRYANGKILRLQRDYCKARGPQGAQARKTLAELRREGTAAGNSWLATGDAIFEGWPSEKLTGYGYDARKDGERAAMTVRSVLGLYAIHQQSMQTGRALNLSEDMPDEAKFAKRAACSFGRACRMIDPMMESDAGIRQDLLALEASVEFDGVLYRVRTLIRKMRSSKSAETIKLDYTRLTHDLYLIQLGGGFRDRVMREWSEGFFTWPPKDKETGSATDTATSK